MKRPGTAVRVVHQIEQHYDETTGYHHVRCQACAWRSGKYRTRGHAFRAAAVHVFQRMKASQ